MTENSKSVSTTLLSVVFWSSSFSGIKTALESYPPAQIMASRFLIASFLLIVLAILTRMRLPHWRDVPLFIFLGFLGYTLAPFGYTLGAQTISAGLTSMMSAITPIFSTLLAIVFFNERLSRWGWFGIGMSIMGIIVLSVGSGGTVILNTGVLFSLGSASLMATFFVLQKPILKRYTPFEITTYTIVAGTIFMLMFVPDLVHSLPKATTSATLALIFLGIFPTSIAYLSWSYALAKAPVALTTNFLYLIPVLGSGIAWIWLGEVPGLSAIIGGICILGGVILVQKMKQNTSVRPPIAKPAL